MPHPDLPEKLRKLASVSQDAAELSWLYYLSGEGKERQAADELVDILLFQAIQKDYRETIALDPPPATDCIGEYPLGTVLYPPGRAYATFGLREQEWIKHMLITGMTGTGKTNLAFQILATLTTRNKPFMVFDWKQNYRDLRQLIEFRDILVFTVGRTPAPFFFNPLIPPPGTEPGLWLMKMVDVLKHAYFVGEGVEYLLRDALDKTYEACGFFDGSRTAIPTFHLVKYHVWTKRVHGRMSLWKASAMRVLDTLCFRHGLGPVVNAEQEWDHQLLLRSGVVLELDALPDSDKVFLTEALILWLYEFRKHEGRREEFKHALIIEEGHHILSRGKESATGTETIMETSLRQIREFGEAVIVIDQEPTKLSNSIKANTYCKVTFALGNGKDALEIATCMGLTPEEARYLNLLEVGQAVVSLKGRVFVPLHVAFPRSPVRKGVVTDADLSVL